ncbi:MAG: phosphate-selective porin OprO/OprP [Arenicella sp.]|jgi:phosphate-selective porin OprO/OprP
MKTKLIAAFIAASAFVATSANAEVEVSTKGGLKVSSGDYKFQFGGRIMYDYNRSELNGVVDEDDFNLRRGRVYVKGNISKDWAFKSQFNVNGDGVEDLYLRYTGFGKGANVTIGNQKMPFGLEELTSSKDISVLERSAITERYAVGRAEGVQLHGRAGGNSTYAIGVFTDDEKDADTGFAARYTTAFKGENGLIHLGLAYKDINDDSALGFEAAVASGPFHAQFEYVDGEDAGNDDLSGYYLQAGYVLTGESRPYKGGAFKRIKPENKSGAWELVARYEDGDGSHSDIELGNTDASAFTIGVNWYAHQNVRFGLNYTDGEDNLSNDDGNELRVRFQLTF